MIYDISGISRSNLGRIILFVWQVLPLIAANLSLKFKIKADEKIAK